ncbi:MAG TPA: hypothetical protein VFD17_01525 [Clostridia bacterium]|nr:hypothetical protein [Clostridia bacterium]
MIVDTNAYVISLVQVFMASMVRDFLIPLFVWKKYLEDKSYSFRFWFCVITQAILQINLVLLLGFFNICNPYTMIASNILIYGLILWNYSDKRFFYNCKESIAAFWSAYKEERFLFHMSREVKNRLNNLKRRMTNWPIRDYIRENWIEVIFLIAMVIYNIWFLTYNAMQYHCYHFSDIPVHQSWIYELEKGNMFADGIYPFGLHSMIYFIRIIFRLNLFEVLMYAGAYQTVILMIGLYLLAKEIFYAKYTPVAVMVITGLMINQGRYSASLPQEVGMFAVVGIAYFMIRYLHSYKEKFMIEGDSTLRAHFRFNSYITRRYINTDAMLLIMCVALVIAYHFYTAIAAIFLIVAIGLAYISRIFKRQYLIPLISCGIIGALIAVFPLVAYRVKGVPFQESMDWATSVIRGETWRGVDEEYQEQMDQILGRESGEINENSDLVEADEEETGVDYSTMNLGETLRYICSAMFHFGSIVMFGESATRFMFICMVIGFFCAISMLLWRRTGNFGFDYMALIFSMIILHILGSAPTLGFTELVAAARASTFAEPFVGFIYMLPIDFIFRILGLWEKRYYKRVLNFLSLMVCGILVIVIIKMGWYHDFFEVNQAYYNEPEYLIRHIKKSYDKHTYTIVSPVDHRYSIIDYGYHTELSEFMDMVNGNQKSFIFPTKYVFFFIEKKVLQDYTYGPVNVDLKYAAMDFVYLADHQDYYFQRAILESQAYYWAQKVLRVYPKTFKVFYEDDIYVAYILEQNVFHPYDLRVDYLSETM